MSKGGKFDDAQQPRVGEAVYPYTGPSGYECMPTVISDDRGPFGRNLMLAPRLLGDGLSWLGGKGWALEKAPQGRIVSIERAGADALLLVAVGGN